MRQTPAESWLCQGTQNLAWEVKSWRPYGAKTYSWRFNWHLSSPWAVQLGLKCVALCWRGFVHPQQETERQRIISHTWIYRNLRRNTAVGSQAVRYCLSGLKAFHVSVFLDGGCSTVRAWGLSVNDLPPEHVKLGLENSLAFIRPNPYFCIQVTTDRWHFL